MGDRIQAAMRNGAPVVIKRATTPEQRASLAVEVECLSRARLPGLVELVEFVEGPEHDQLITVSAGTVTLSDLGSRDLGVAAELLAGVAAAVAELHQTGWSHGAVQADHVIVGPRRVPRLCSLGSSTQLDQRSERRDLDDVADLIALVVGSTDAHSRRHRRQRRDLLHLSGQARDRDATAAWVARSLAELSPGPTPPAELIPIEADLRSDQELRPLPEASDHTRTWRNRVDRIPSSESGRLGSTEQPAWRQFGRGAWGQTIVFCGWCLGLVLSLWVLTRLGRGSLSAPLRPSEWTPWVAEVGSAMALVAILRSVGLLAVWYLAFATVVGAAARGFSAESASGWSDRFTPRRLRALLDSARGVTAVGLVLAVAVAPLARSAPSGHEQVANVSTGGTSTGTPTARLPSPPVRIPPGEAAPAYSYGTEALVAGGGHPLLPVASTSSVQAEDPVRGAISDVWVAATGDHFWGIATETLEDRFGRAPNESEIMRYWVALVEVNASRLVAPGNPDLIYPGQEFVLPAP